MPGLTTSAITVIKLNPARQELWRYTGHIVERLEQQLTLEARFNRDDLPFHGILLARGDLFIETFFADRWYNIFEIHDRNDDHLKGWYCNVTYPAELDQDEVRYVDLALDLLVYPDGSTLILDEDEFTALDLDETTTIQAHRALDKLVSLAQNCQLPGQTDWRCG